MGAKVFDLRFRFPKSLENSEETRCPRHRNDRLGPLNRQLVSLLDPLERVSIVYRKQVNGVRTQAGGEEGLWEQSRRERLWGGGSRAKWPDRTPRVPAARPTPLLRASGDWGPSGAPDPGYPRLRGWPRCWVRKWLVSASSHQSLSGVRNLGQQIHHFECPPKNSNDQCRSQGYWTLRVTRLRNQENH